MKNEPSATQIDEHHSHFVSIYDYHFNEVNPIPQDKNVTVYCEGGQHDSIGYVWDIKGKDIGIEALIAKKWILQSHLEALMKINNIQD